ncbi:MAG: histidine phosphatase family protein [Clostridia bacterium]|nr:histidine phosphatase family protein [Clostridia bacterium]
MNLYVLRHGQTDLNIQNKFQGRVDTQLNNTGIKQVEASREELKEIDFDLVFVSPLKRAIDTAKIVTSKELIIDQRIIERSFGKLEGKPGIPNYEEKIDLYEIETIEEMKKRVYCFLDEIKEKYADKENILIVTHEGVAQVINSYFKRMDTIKEFRLNNGAYIVYKVISKEKLMKKLEAIELKRKMESIAPQELEMTNVQKKKLHIVYLMVWTKVCGGSKIILEYANRLAAREHRITLISYDEYPNWFELNENVSFVQVPENSEQEDWIPDCDIIVSTSWKNIYQAIHSKKAPVVFFEQGGSHIFDIENLSKEKYEAVRDRFKLLKYIYTVSSFAKDKIKEHYHKDSEVICNAIDSSVFYYDSNLEKDKSKINITIIGSEKFKFKNIDESLEAIRIIQNKYKNIELNWISQDIPEKNKEKAIVNPKPTQIGDILRKTDIFICNSEYESFCLPALEAMTCGAAVMTTDNGGIRDFVKNEENALIIEKHNINDIVNKIEYLIENTPFREKISRNGIETSKKFDWEESVNQTEKYYFEISKNIVKE